MFVRTASERDLEAVRALLVETWRATYDGFYGAARVTEITNEWHSLASLKARLVAPRSEFVVADDGKTIAGMAFASADETGDEVSLRNLYVLPSWQSRGIGGMLLEEIEASFPDAKRFTLEVEGRNEKSVRFYQTHGYVDQGQGTLPAASPCEPSTTRRMLKRQD